MNKPRPSLSRSLSLSLMLMAVPIFMLSLGIFYAQSRKLFHKEAEKYSNSILTTAQQHVISYMNAVANVAKSNAWLLEESFTPDSLQAISQRIVAGNRCIISCSVGTEPNMFPQLGRSFSIFTVNEGDTIITAREHDYDYFDKIWYKTVRKNDKACWINPFSDYSEASLDYSDAVASYSLPLHSDDGRIVGVAATDFSFSRLAKNLKTLVLPYSSAYFILLGGDGRYLVHPENNLLFKKTIFSETDADNNPELIALGHEMTAGRSGTAHISLDGKERHVSYGPVTGTDWSLALVIDKDEIMSSHNHMGYVILVLIIVGLFAIYWLSYRVVRQTITPINQLLDVTEKITQGEYDKTIPLSSRKDAVGQLQNSFSAMQQAIMAHMGRIEQTAQEIGQYNLEENEKVLQAEEAIKKKNQFLSHVLSHVMTPLDAIRECANIMRNRPGLPKQEKEALVVKIRQNTVTMHRMVLMLFDISETRATDISIYKRDDDVFCNQVARDCIDYIHGVFNLEMGFETEVPENLQVKTSHLFLVNTIRELLYNACKYSDGQHILVRVSQTPDVVRFTIQDVGPGLPEGLQNDIFEPFMKKDNLSEGLGLGLPLCKRHAFKLGGDLIYDTGYKEGCRFILEIPKS